MKDYYRISAVTGARYHPRERAETLKEVAQLCHGVNTAIFVYHHMGPGGINVSHKSEGLDNRWHGDEAEEIAEAIECL